MSSKYSEENGILLSSFVSSMENLEKSFQKAIKIVKNDCIQKVKKGTINKMFILYHIYLTISFFLHELIFFLRNFHCHIITGRLQIG